MDAGMFPDGLLPVPAPETPVAAFLPVVPGRLEPAPPVADINCDPPAGPAWTTGRRLSFIWDASMSAALLCFFRIAMTGLLIWPARGFLTSAPVFGGPSFVSRLGSIAAGFPVAAFPAPATPVLEGPEPGTAPPLACIAPRIAWLTPARRRAPNPLGERSNCAG